MLRSAWSSPSMFTPRTASRPDTGSFQIALVPTLPLPRSIGRGLPTFTATTLAIRNSLAGYPVVTGGRYPCQVATIAASVAEICAGAKRASRELARLDTTTKNAAISAMADALEARADEILEANARDMEAGREAELDASLLDRLLLTEERVAGIASDARRIVALPDPVGEVISGYRMYNGLDLRQVRVPLGVVAVVYEARPNVTIDCSALCIKSGNAIVLRGSSTAASPNAALEQVAQSSVAAAGLPDGAISIDASGDRDELREIVTQDDHVDLVIPRGGEGLKAALKEHATVPVIYAAAGNCHVFVDASADLDDAVAIAVNAKVQRPGVCNSAETLLVHGDVAADVYVKASTRFTDGGVFGMGAEIGNSTQKLHARGPIGVRELTTYKYVVEGSGQVRD